MSAPDAAPQHCARPGCQNELNRRRSLVPEGTPRTCDRTPTGRDSGSPSLLAPSLVGLIAHRRRTAARARLPGRKPVGLLADMGHTFGFAPAGMGAVVARARGDHPRGQAPADQGALEADEAIPSRKERKGTDVIEQM